MTVTDLSTRVDAANGAATDAASLPSGAMYTTPNLNGSRVHDARTRLAALPAHVEKLVADTTPAPTDRNNTAPAPPPSLRNLHLKTITGKLSGRTTIVFYAVVLTVALIGTGTAAERWLGWFLPAALVAAGAYEFGGVVLSMHADERRKLGERAIAARLLSAAFAAGAVALNWFGHDHMGQAGFFAGFSLLGYLVYLLISAAKRRDYLRAAGMLDETPPVYGVGEWLRSPSLTRRAKVLASADPSLGRLGSLAAARAEVRAEKRQAAIATALRKRITDHLGPVQAEIAVQTYDLDEIARRLAAAADYDRLTELIGEDLVPDRVAPPAPAPAAEVPAWRRALVPVDSPAVGRAEVPPAVEAEVPVAEPVALPAAVRTGTVRRNLTGTRRRKQAEPKARRSAEETRRMAAELLAAEPTLTQAEVAARLGISTRRLREVTNQPDTPTTPKES